MRTPWRTGGSPTTAPSSTPISATAFSFPTAPTTRRCGPSQVLQTRGYTSPGSKRGRKSFSRGSIDSYASYKKQEPPAVPGGSLPCSKSIVQIDAPASRHSLENEIVRVARIREEHRSGRPLRVVLLVREILGPDGRRPGLAVHAEPHVQQRDRIALREVVGIEPRRTDDLEIRAHERAQLAAEGMAELQ